MQFTENFKSALSFPYKLNGKNLNSSLLYFLSHVNHDSIKSNLIEIDKITFEKMEKSRKYVLGLAESSQSYYGINTGFGALSKKKISGNELIQLQKNLIRSHCVGVGEPFSAQMTKAIMILRAHCLTSGHSGLNPQAVKLLVDFVNFDIIPIVPRKGSVGASGDLAPLAHIALTLMGEGEVIFKGKKILALEAIKKCNLTPLELGPKDGLALINGTTVMNVLAAMALYESKQLIKLADIIGALTIEGINGSVNPFDEKISNLRPHPGQLDCAQNVRRLLAESPILKSHENCDRVQDPYSLRCIPQVHGACRQIIYHAEEVIDRELNCVTDNPLIFPEHEQVISGGNFHGQTLAFAMDYMAMGLSELSQISERRVEKMMNPEFSRLPAFLTKNPGPNSGLMIAHVTHAALVSQNKGLCHPASIDSIPTSTDKEDHVSMGLNAGLKLHEILNNLKYCFSIELLCNTQALEFQRPNKSSQCLENVYDIIRKNVPPIEEDRVFANDINEIFQIIETNDIVHSVEKIIGELK